MNIYFASHLPRHKASVATPPTPSPAPVRFGIEPSASFPSVVDTVQTSNVLTAPLLNLNGQAMTGEAILCKLGEVAINTGIKSIKSHKDAREKGIFRNMLWATLDDIESGVGFVMKQIKKTPHFPKEGELLMAVTYKYDVLAAFLSMEPDAFFMADPDPENTSKVDKALRQLTQAGYITYLPPGESYCVETGQETGTWEKGFVSQPDATSLYGTDSGIVAFTPKGTAILNEKFDKDVPAWFFGPHFVFSAF